MRVSKTVVLLGLGAGLASGALVYSKKAQSKHAADVATYEMMLPPMESTWVRKPHGPFLKEKFVSRKTGSMITLGESHGDADYVLTPDVDERSLAQQVVHAGEANGWKTVSVGEPLTVGGARFVYVERTAGTHTYWTAVGVQGNSNYILALTASGSEKDREAALKTELPYFKQMVESSTFHRDAPNLVASL